MCEEQVVYFRESVRRSALKYVSHENFQIYVGTWNCGAKVADPIDVEKWLTMELLGQPSSKAHPDIVAIGLQEMIELSATNVIGSTVVKSLSTEKSAKWIESILSVLNKSGSSIYELVATESIVGLWIGVFVDISVLGCISDLSTSIIATGNGGFGNKGAVGVHMRVYDSSLCFINAHLTANQDQLLKRNEDYMNIMRKLVFVDNVNSASLKNLAKGQRNAELIKTREMVDSVQSRVNALQASLRLTDESKNAFKPLVSCVDQLKTITIDDHDVVFWCGDLNYRLTEDISLEDAFARIQEGRSFELILYDQLTIERDAEEVFHGFHEGMLVFNPTYKFIAGTTEYEQRPERVRMPSWCDRIMWRVGRKRREETGAQRSLDIRLHFQMEPMTEIVELMKYESCPDIVMSDHRPVRAIFNLRARRYDYSHKHISLMKLYHEWKKLSNSDVQNNS